MFDFSKPERRTINLTTTTRNATVSKSKKKLKTFVFKALWPSTALTIRVEAPNEDKAWEKAIKRKDLAGSLDLQFIEER